MKTVKDWTTTELIEFLNSYNRATNVSEKDKFKNLYLYAREEIIIRMPIMAVIY